MDESFLHYVWQFQHFSHRGLTTSAGQPLQILYPGYSNRDAGPDFLQAKLRLGGLLWTGHVEIHHTTTDWYRHEHHTDPAYSNVILHVVWEKSDKPPLRSDGTEIPELVLEPRVERDQIEKYDSYMKIPDGLRCRNFLKGMHSIHRYGQFDKALVMRLDQKSEIVREELKATSGDWEETAYRCFARSFGFKVNAEPFYRLSRHLPHRIIKRLAGKQLQLEAMIFGMGGFLEEPARDEYQELLKREFQYLLKKFNLEASGLERHHWKFARLRPANFPTVRLAQFAAVAGVFDRLFSDLFIDVSAADWLAIMRVGPSEYWISNYDFGKPSVRPQAAIGEESLRTLLINSWVPLLAALAIERDDHAYMERAMDILQQVKAEDNRITRLWKQAGVKLLSALDSQSAIQTYNTFCLPKRCLNCAIGIEILR